MPIRYHLHGPFTTQKFSNWGIVEYLKICYFSFIDLSNFMHMSILDSCCTFHNTADPIDSLAPHFAAFLSPGIRVDKSQTSKLFLTCVSD